jgi:hypothetical protein
MTSPPPFFTNCSKCWRRPIWSVAIEDDGLIDAEIRLEVREVFTKAGRGSDGDLE